MSFGRAISPNSQLIFKTQPIEISHFSKTSRSGHPQPTPPYSPPSCPPSAATASLSPPAQKWAMEKGRIGLQRGLDALAQGVAKRMKANSVLSGDHEGTLMVP